ncbi:MAG: phospholipid carrier-dependent glycosyltransferase [Chloroflexales bacterium]
MRIPSRRAAWLAPLLIFALALVTRLWSLNWGLPYVEHPDEPALVEVALRMVRDGSLNPHIFLYPSLYYYLLAVTARLHLVWGVAAGLYGSVQDLVLKTYLFTTQPQLYLWLRAVTALLGAITPPVLYILGARMFDQRVGLLAAVALAVSRFHIEHSHYITTDALTGLWVTITLLGAWQVAQQGSWHGYLLGAIGIGLAGGTKYNAVMVCGALVVAVIIYLRDHDGRGLPGQIVRLVAAGMLSGLVFLVTTPYALLDYSSFIHDLLFDTAGYSKGLYGNFQGRWNIGGYLSFFWAEGLMPPACLAIIFGTPLLLRRWPRQSAILLAAIILVLLMLLSLATHFLRNLLPIFPPLYLIAAAGAVAITDWVKGFFREGRDLHKLASPLIAFALTAPQAAGSAWLLGYWGQTYSLEQAATELRAQPRGMLAAVELNPVQWAGDPAVQPVKWLATHPADWYRARGYRFLALSADRYSVQDQAAYQRVLGYGEAILQLPDRDLGVRPGPGGALIDLGAHPELIPFARRPASFGGRVQLLGYELGTGEPRARISPLEGADAHTLKPGQPVQINLYWRALAQMDVDYTLFVHILDAAGNKVAQRDLPLRYADYPTSRWRPGELVIDRADMSMPPLPPGEYRFQIGLYNAATGEPMAPDGLSSGANLVLTTVTVRE